MSHLEPSFFIIGERKCGTSALFRYLTEHPNVLPGKRKEMQFFTKGESHVRKHFADYLADFPLLRDTGEVQLNWPELSPEGVLYEEQLEFERTPGTTYITGEASADTLCDCAPELLREFLPGLQLVAILRDPAERAFSHHRMFHRFHEEGRDLSFIPGDFSTDMRDEMRRIADGEITPCLSPSLYVEHLVHWADVWNRQLMVVFSASLDDPTTFPQCMSSIVRHIGLPPHAYALEQRYNQAPARAIPGEILAELRDFFAPYDRALEAHLGRPLPW